MRIIKYRDVEKNKDLKSIFFRELTFDEQIESSVREIINNVRANGDSAVLSYTKQFDNVDLDKTVNKTVRSIAPVPENELHELHAQVSEEFIDALRGAIKNIREFHSHQLREDIWVEKDDGVRMGLRYTPLSSVGLYVPGGAAAYPSTIVMNAVPAQVAGVERIAAVTPPGQFRNNPHVAAAFVELGITEVYTVGGAQAVAALAYGTESIPRVDKIVGPGNMYVAVAKKMVYGQVDIDMIAGPSEIVVVADENAEPEFVAADLLSQAEHGSGMEMAVLLTPSNELASEVQKELIRQVGELEHSDSSFSSFVVPLRRTGVVSLRRTGEIQKVLDANAIIIVNDLDEAVEAVNRIAPEHLELMVKEPENMLDKIKNAGAIFLGSFSPEPVSDYFGGTNHVLPTSGAARYASPLGVYDFQKCSNIVEYTKRAVEKCCKAVTVLARSEGFEAHARSVAIRCRNEDMKSQE